MKRSLPWSSHGFTLLEVMVALAILAVLTVMTAQTINSGLANKAKFQADVARESGVRDALSVIQSDVGAAFHHRDILVSMMNELSKKQNPTGPGSNPNDPVGGIIPPVQPTPPPVNPQGQGGPGLPEPRATPVNLTGFVGRSDAMFFTVMNHTRTTRDAKESDQAKVGYFLKDCKSHTSPGKRTKCLIRSLSTSLDDDVTKTGPEAVLLENVEEFSLKYLVPGQEEFAESWKVGAMGREKSDEQNFPLAVQVSLTVHDKNNPKDKPFAASVLAPIRFPNNPNKKASDNTAGTGQNPSGPGNPTPTPRPGGH